MAPFSRDVFKDALIHDDALTRNGPFKRQHIAMTMRRQVVRRYAPAVNDEICVVITNPKVPRARVGEDALRNRASPCNDLVSVEA